MMQQLSTILSSRRVIAGNKYESGLLFLLTQSQKVKIYFFIGLLFIATPAVHGYCWQEAGRAFAIDPVLLYAIAQQESNLNMRARAINRDGSRDIGLMQINSIHFNRLRALGITEQQLQHNACLSVMVGASILASMMERYGYSWEAVGAYNAGTAPQRKALRMKYAQVVWRRYKQANLMFDDTVSYAMPLNKLAVRF
ncbi:transglycosylase SLT domain-containing protein [Chromobacterium piscinae]|uniref:Transglycosylase SLT domain-containing protein n=1 Tax=Chromobacterium piscinae TaxID=686831 RepID=A0ABV0H974_9NEIS